MKLTWVFKSSGYTRVLLPDIQTCGQRLNFCFSPFLYHIIWKHCSPRGNHILAKSQSCPSIMKVGDLNFSLTNLAANVIPYTKKHQAHWIASAFFWGGVPQCVIIYYNPQINGFLLKQTFVSIYLCSYSESLKFSII